MTKKEEQEDQARVDRRQLRPPTDAVPHPATDFIRPEDEAARRRWEVMEADDEAVGCERPDGHGVRFWCYWNNRGDDPCPYCKDAMDLHLRMIDRIIERQALVLPEHASCNCPAGNFEDCPLTADQCYSRAFPGEARLPAAGEAPAVGASSLVNDAEITKQPSEDPPS